MQGRVFSAAEAALTGPYAASIGLGAVLISTVSFRAMYAANAVVLAASGLYLFAVRPAKAGAGEEIVRGKDRLHAPQGIVPPD